MIKINLASRKSANVGGVEVGTRTSIGAIGSSEFVEILRLPKVIGLILLGFTFYLSVMILDSHKSGRLLEMDAQIEKETEIAGDLKKKLSESKALDKLKKELENDEKVLQTKFDVVTKLGENRNVPMRILIKFSELIPKDVWISDFTMNPGSGGVFIKGFSTTFDQISAFSAALQGTIYFSSASPKSNTKVKDGSGVEVISFEMPLERRK